MSAELILKPLAISLDLRAKSFVSTPCHRMRQDSNYIRKSKMQYDKQKFYSQKTDVQTLDLGNSLAVHWLGLHAFTAHGPGSTPAQGAKIP